MKRFSYLPWRKRRRSCGRSIKPPSRQLATHPFEELEERTLLVGNWHNALLPLNVSGESAGTISPLDAMLVINEINSPKYSDSTTGLLIDVSSEQQPAPFFDVTCDGYVSPRDALRMINWLNGASLFSKNPIGRLTSGAFPTWQVTESGGSVEAKGEFTSRDCSGVMQEGDSFMVELQTAFTVPEAGAIGSGRDAFFNVTEGETPTMSRDVDFDSGSISTVRVDLSSVPAGTDARLAFRFNQSRRRYRHERPYPECVA